MECRVLRRKRRGAGPCRGAQKKKNCQTKKPRGGKRDRKEKTLNTKEPEKVRVCEEEKKQGKILTGKERRCPKKGRRRTRERRIRRFPGKIWAVGENLQSREKDPEFDREPKIRPCVKKEKDKEKKGEKKLEKKEERDGWAGNRSKNQKESKVLAELRPFKQPRERSKNFGLNTRRKNQITRPHRSP